MNKIPTIKYTDRDFASIKEALINYAKIYYPNTFKDLNEAGINALLIDLVSYTGDILSFYLDYQANESFLQSAVEFANILRHGKSLGYKHTENPTSTGMASFYVVVPATLTGQPDPAYMPTLRQNSTFESNSGSKFILVDDVDFSLSNDIVVATSNPITYAVKASGRVISGQRGVETISVGAYKKFLRLSLQTLDIAEIESVVDAEGHVYYEVDHLSENTIYEPILNIGDDRELAPSILRAKIVPRRFVADRERRRTYLQFGYGSDSTLFDTNIADPSNVMLRMIGKDYVSSTSFDPNKLLSTDKFGVVPANTTLTINFRANTTNDVNVAVGTLRSVSTPRFFFQDVQSLNTTTLQQVISSLEVDNEEPIIGDVNLSSVDEIKQRIFDSYATQKRAVTALDYAALIYNMPQQYGRIKRVGVYPSDKSDRREIKVYLMCEDSNGYLVSANNTLKQNVKTWLLKHKMLHDFISIEDGYVINLGVYYRARADATRNVVDIKVEASNLLIKQFAQKKNFGEPFLLKDIYEPLKATKGILDVVGALEITQRRGSLGDKTYSNINFDPSQHYSDDGLYIECPKNAIFEIKYLNLDGDIQGEIT